MITILFLSANPENTDKLDLNRECNEINNEIRFAAGKDLFKIEQYHDISISEIRKQLLNYRPQIVHFSGHGSPRSELIFKNENGSIEVVPSIALARLFEILSKDISIVFLNACYSQDQAESIAKHVNCVIGMSRAISDKAAIKFAVSFYSTLGFGRSVKDAFDLAVNDLTLEKIPEEATPQICIKEGIDPSKMFIPPNVVNNGNSDICSILKNIKEYRQKVLMRKMSIKELFNSIADPLFNFLSVPNNEKKIGELNSNALNLLLTNFSGKLMEYDDALGIGNNSQANLLLNESLMVLKKIIDKLEEICRK